MKATAPVDSLPQFKGLGLRSSELMLAAKAHLAKGEPFQAAVRWVEAGRAFADLAEALVQEGYAYAAAQDFLNSAHCFLEAGDYRPAEASLEKLDDFTHLATLVAKDDELKAEYQALHTRCNKHRESFQRAYTEARALMPEAKYASRLSDKWLNEVLAAMPGVPDFHWLAAKKDTLRNRAERAIDHYRLCCRLKPDFMMYWFVLVARLIGWERWDEARTEAEQGLARFPRDPLAWAQVAWVKTILVINKLAPKKTLGEAKKLFESALDSEHLSGEYYVRIACGLSLCVERLGKTAEAEGILQRAIRRWPSPAADLALELLRLKPAERERHVLTRVPDLLAA